MSDFGLYAVTVTVATRMHADGPGTALIRLENRLRTALAMASERDETPRLAEDSETQILAGEAVKVS